jgi:cytochrome P450
MEPAVSSSAPFSISDHNPPGFRQNIATFVINTLLPAFMRLVCRFAPVWRMPGTNVVLVTGFDSLQEVYSRQFDFEVPYEARVEILHWQWFLLAMQDTPEYHEMYNHIFQLWQPEDTTRVKEIARATTESILTATRGDLDLIQDLVKPVLMAIVEQHYGVVVPADQVQPFLDGNLASSGFVFGGPKITKRQVETANASIGGVWAVIDAAMAAARKHPDPTTILGRYYAGRHPDPGFPEEKMRSALMTMIGGYLPTCLNASGRITDVLLSRPDAMQFVQEAVRAGEDGILLTGLMEALRLDYIIPFLWRRAALDTVVGEGTTRHKSIRKGRILCVSLQAAMYDRRRVKHPKRFDPDRSSTVRMVYGHEFHNCIGASIANAVLTEIFKGLLKRNPVRSARKKKIRWVGAYPWNFWLTLSEAGDAT